MWPVFWVLWAASTSSWGSEGSAHAPAEAPLGDVDSGIEWAPADRQRPKPPPSAVSAHGEASPAPESSPSTPPARKSVRARHPRPQSRPVPPPPVSALGPATEAERETLLGEARKSHSEGDFAEAARLLSRLLDRYPGQPGGLEARLLLGDAEIRAGRPERAIEPLRAVVTAAGNTIEGLRAKLRLAEAMIEAKKLTEGLLAAGEIANSAPPSGAGARVRFEAQLVKARAFTRMGKDPDATAALDSARASLQKQAEKQDAEETEGGIREWRGLLSGEALRVKLADCARLPSEKRLTEAQSLHQIGRRGDCVVEATALLADALMSESEAVVIPVAKDLETGARAFLKACENPPPPPYALSRAEGRLYRQELSLRLLPKCQGRLAEAADLLRDRKARLGAGMSVWADRVIAVLAPGEPRSKAPAKARSRGAGGGH